MKKLLLALQFLTLAPVKTDKVTDKEIAGSAVYFPAVGALLGLVLASAGGWLGGLAFPRLSVDVILVILLIVLTGGIHLDGLSDTFDALLSGKNKDEMLTIMRDSHAGVMGILAVACVLLAKIAFLYAISDAHKVPALILMGVLGRWSMVFMMRTFRYARRDGKGKIYFEGMNRPIFAVSTLFTLSLAVALWHVRGLGVFLIVTGFVYLFGKGVSKKINGITGDTLGAADEMTEAVTLGCVALLEKVL